MNITHYMTIDTGSGPASFVEIEGGEEKIMIRVRHNARFERAVAVDARQVRDMIAKMANLGTASTTVPHDRTKTLEADVLRWMTAEMPRATVPQALRWLEDGNALLFRTDAEARQYDAAHETEDDRPRPAKQRRAMMG